MNIIVLIRVAATVGLIFYAGFTSAHHSVPTNYFLYAEGGVELMGTVKEFDVRNPHSLITLDVLEDDGSVTEWLVEWSDGNSLRRRGVEIARVKVGEEVVVHARKHRHVENVAYVRDVIVSDGTIVRDCGAGIYRGDEFYATCDEAETAQADVENLSEALAPR